MLEIKADLHCHTTHSDGSYTPLELIQQAKKIGLNALSITDHDAISAYEEVACLPQDEIRILPGVELSTTFGETQIHVLGYAFDPNAKVLQEFCQACRKHRIERNKEILDKLWNIGIRVEEKDIVKSDDLRTAYGRPHIAKGMIDKGYVATIQEAFRKYIGEGKPCYVPGKKYSVEEAIEAIHASSGFAVIAHPHLIYTKKVLNELLKCQFDGLEAYYCRFDAGVDEKWAVLAKERGLFTTGGSDFHGSTRPVVKLGCKLDPAEVFLCMWDHFQKIGTS